jgi:hypothetical protein
VLQAQRAAANVLQHPLPQRVRNNRTHLLWSGEVAGAAHLIELLPRRKPKGATR